MAIQICLNCGTETLCPECDHDRYNRPLVIKYIDKEMPVIIHTCVSCHVELFRSITYETKTLHKNYCIACSGIIETESWKYRDLCK